MIDHTGTYATDYEASLRFYEKAFEALGYRKNMELVSTWDAAWPTRRMAGFGAGEKPSFWLAEVKERTSPYHFAFVAPSRAHVDAFYKAAMAAGGKDNGAPGPRPQYHENYYGAFVHDPDGNNIEAVCHAPAGK